MLDLGEGEVEDAEPEGVKPDHHLEQLLRPVPGQDLDVGVAVDQGHLHVGDRRPGLGPVRAAGPGRVLREGEEVGEEGREVIAGGRG